MQHSIVARNVTRTAARYVRSTTTSRERRLGIVPPAPVQTPPAHPTAFGRDDLGPYVLLRARWRSFAPATLASAAGGRVRHSVRMAWSGAGRSTGRRAGAPATWPD